MPIAPFLFRSVLLAAAIVSGAAPAAQAQTVRATYDFYIAGLRVGELALQTREEGGAYAAASQISAAGLVGIFASFYFDGRASGQVQGGGGVVPVRYDADSKSPRAERRTEIDWKDGTPVQVSVEPPRDSAPAPAAQAGTLDPVSAGFVLLRDQPVGGICNKTVDVFDGSRRSRLKVAAAQPAEDGLVCRGTFARIEGEAHSMTSEREFPFELVFRPTGDGLAELQRIETKTRFGRAVLQRRG